MKAAERNYNWDYLRFFASVAVVVLHVSYGYMPVVSVDSASFAVMAAYNATTRFAVPVFFMLSGLFLLPPEKEISVKGCWKRTLRLLLFFYIWSAFYAFQGLAVDFVTGQPVTDALLFDSFRRFLFGHGHMWFMFCLAAYYLILPVARSISANRAALIYFCAFWIVLRFVIPFISTWVPMDYIVLWIGQLDLKFFASYFGYFCLGYCLQITDISKRWRGVLYGLGASAAFGIFALTVYDSRKAEELVEDWVSPGSLLPLVCAVAIFVYFKYHGEFLGGKGNRVITILSRYSLLIYILHPFFVEKLQMLGINANTFNEVISIPVLSALIVLSCVCVAWVIDRIPILDKLLLK